MELKVLAADKITAYQNYVFLHEKLFECVGLEECFETAKILLENYLLNRRIFAEMAFYRENGRILGKHPIFAERKRIASYEKMSTVELLKKKMLLEKSIWRLEAAIRKGDRPALTSNREELIASHRRSLSTINQLLKDRK